VDEAYEQEVKRADQALRVPRGNRGCARVGALRPMPVPEDLRHLVP